MDFRAEVKDGLLIWEGCGGQGGKPGRRARHRERAGESWRHGLRNRPKRARTPHKAGAFRNHDRRHCRPCDRCGGRGIPVRVDHTVDAEIDFLFEQVRLDHGRLDLLVNNAWGGYEDYAHHGGDASVFDAVFWEQPIERWDKMWNAGVRATLATTKTALPLMFSQNTGIIINTTLEIDPNFYDAALYYRTAKLAINYLTFGMARDIYQRGGFPIPVIGLAMGWMRTEAVMESFRQGLRTPEELAQTDSVELGGRAVLALVNDPTLLEKTGKIFRVRDLAQEYRFEDRD